MSLQMSLVFTIAVLEMAIVSVLLLPLPMKVQNLLIQQYQNMLNNSNFKIVISFIDVIIGILFVDSFKNGFGMLNSKTDEIIEFNKSNIWDLRSKKFYSQRNLYILGSIFVFQGAIWFIIMLLKSTTKHKQELVNLSKQDNKQNVELDEEISKLELDVKTLNKQYDSLWEEYQKKNKDNTTITKEEKKDN